MKKLFCLLFAAALLLLTACGGGVAPETEDPTAPATVPATTAPATTAPATAPSVGALSFSPNYESLTQGKEYSFMITASGLPADQYNAWGISVSSADETVLEVLSWENLGYGEDVNGDGFITCQAEVRVLKAGTAKLVARVKAANLEAVHEVPVTTATGLE